MAYLYIYTHIHIHINIHILSLCIYIYTYTYYIYNLYIHIYILCIYIYIHTIYIWTFPKMGVLPKSSIFFKHVSTSSFWLSIPSTELCPSQRNAGVQSIGVTHFLALHLGPWDQRKIVHDISGWWLTYHWLVIYC